MKGVYRSFIIIRSFRHAFTSVCAVLYLALLLPGCDPFSIGGASSQSSSGNFTSGEGQGEAWVEFKMQFDTSNGSFDDPSALAVTGTTPGTLFAATRAFLADGSSVTGNDWPSWILSFGVSLTGSASSSAPVCAKFGSTPAANCNLSSSTLFCNGPDTFYQVSEAACSAAPIATNGDGSLTDSVQVAFTVDRESGALGTSENLLLDLEYIASTPARGPTDAADCFQESGAKNFGLSVGGCISEQWKLFLIDSDANTIIPFLQIIPPFTGQHLQAATQDSGDLFVAGVQLQHRQIIIPLASYPSVDRIQISRTYGESSSVCVSGSDSALCSGVVFKTIRVTRI